ncbi:MAG: hypothetical protein V3U31_07740 [Dehalococcoidia bacterium]
MTQHKELPLFLRRLSRSAQQHPHLTPGCPFGEEVAHRLEAVEQGLREARSRFLWLMLWLSGAVAAEVVLRLVRG